MRFEGYLPRWSASLSFPTAKIRSKVYEYVISKQDIRLGDLLEEKRTRRIQEDVHFETRVNKR